MNFSTLRLSDRDRLMPVLAAQKTGMRDFTFASLYMWTEACRVACAECAGRFLIRSRDEISGRDIYAIPHSGSDFLYAVSCLEELQPEGFLLRSLDAGNAALLREKFGDRVQLSFLPEEEDYVYLLSDLSAYPGRKYSQKRNHVHAFLRENGSYTLEDIDAGTLPLVRSFYRTYRSFEEDADLSARREGEAVWRVLDAFSELPVRGWLLRAGGVQPVGFCIGEVQGQTLFLHIEKALQEVRGAYPLLVQATARTLSDRILYENREEDDGNEGLRRSKRSYHPCRMLRKYRAEIAPVG